MKLVIYNLNTDGTIPDYIIDGGYLTSGNNNPAPQDLDLVGVATDAAPQTAIASEAALLAYCQSKNFTFKDPITEEVTPLDTVVSSIWSKLG
jgi:hypothetical protein